MYMYKKFIMNADSWRDSCNLGGGEIGEICMYVCVCVLRRCAVRVRSIFLRSNFAFKLQRVNSRLLLIICVRACYKKLSGLVK